MITNLGLTKSSLKPFLIFNSSLVITQELLSSLPAALIVKITPIGRAFIGFFSWLLKSQGSKSTNAPQAIAFAESITEPPPTAKIIST